MKPENLDKNPLSEFKFDPEQTLEQFTKERMKEELGLVKDFTPEQLEEIIHNRQFKQLKNKPKGKTLYFKDFIKQIAEDPDDSDIIDAEIIKKAIKIKVENEEL